MGVEEAKTLLERDGYKMLDVRDWKSYDKEHLTKPPQCTANVPLGDGEDLASFVARVREGGFRDGAKLLVADAAGPGGVAAADALAAAGFERVVGVEGGYDGWRAVFTTCGRRRPPQGKWISTGKGGESLKSGLTLDPNVASAYEENWGKPPPVHNVAKARENLAPEEPRDGGATRGGGGGGGGGASGDGGGDRRDAASDADATLRAAVDDLAAKRAKFEAGVKSYRAAEDALAALRASGADANAAEAAALFRERDALDAFLTRGKEVVGEAEALAERLRSTTVAPPPRDGAW
jgi:rhodanese-related sulfurtransferase